jgi:hypothetical protein
MLKGEALREGGMSQGIILLLVIAAIVTYVIIRTRRRMGLLVTAKTWITLIIAFVIIVLAMWAASTR